MVANGVIEVFRQTSWVSMPGKQRDYGYSAQEGWSCGCCSRAVGLERGSQKGKAIQRDLHELTARLEKLHNRPDGDVLEGGIGIRQESIEVSVHSTVWLVPNIVESGVIVR